MKKSIPVNKKSRGRPKKKGGVHPVSAVRLPPQISEAVDAWAAKQADEPSRSEAIRRLVELGLKVKTPARSVSKPGRRLRAQELATKTIEKMIDPAAVPEERAQRRRRLTNGPSEFREDRVDQPKAKK
jgi:Arc/MetJ-type ribon-helix-helix transcriptional regulator